MVKAEIRIDDLLTMAKWAKKLKLHKKHPGYTIKLLIAESKQEREDAKNRKPLGRTDRLDPVVGFAVFYGADDFWEGSYEVVEQGDKP